MTLAMTGVTINSSETLRAWLTDKPQEWAQAIALRAALRALPYIHLSSKNWLASFALLPFRALVTSWTQIVDQSIFVRTDESRANAAFGGETFDFKLYESSPIAALAADASYHSADAQSQSIHVTNDCVKSVDVAAAASDSASVVPSATNWRNISADCDLLVKAPDLSTASQMLSRIPLWQGKQPPQAWFHQCGLCWKRLERLDRNYPVWIDWFELRIFGRHAAFDIPGDRGRVEEKKILVRLAEATDEDFWDKGHEYVNATLKGWLEEARARVASAQALPVGMATETSEALALPPLPPQEPSGTFDITGDASGTVRDPINPDPQDVRSPQFGLDPTGRIAISADAGADQLRSDAQSLSRHARALQKAQRLAETLRNHNNAGYMTEMASDYVAAMEGGPDGPDPSGLVFAGDQLREAIAKHRAAGADDDLQPLPTSADRDASAFLSAHNMYVGLDPFLDDLDRTTRGPDAPLPSANPEEIRQIATTARQADILAEPTYDYMVAASNAAPATYDSAERHSRFAAGLAQNFARYGIEFLWTYPNEAAWVGVATGVGATVILGPLAAAGGTIAGITIAYHVARNMIANEAVYRKLVSTSPAGEDNFNRLMRFLKSLPYKSLKDD